MPGERYRYDWTRPEVTMAYVVEYNKQERIRELEQMIASVCIKCPHARFATGHFECKVGRRHCHSVRVRRWLDEIKKLEGG